MRILLDFHGVAMKSLWPFLCQFCGISLASGILLGFLLDCHVSLVTLVFHCHVQRISIGFLWDFHDMSMIFLWDCCGTCRLCPWEFFGTLMGLRWHPSAISIDVLQCFCDIRWDSNRLHMEFQCNSSGISKYFHWIPMGFLQDSFRISIIFLSSSDDISLK